MLHLRRLTALFICLAVFCLQTALRGDISGLHPNGGGGLVVLPGEPQRVLNLAAGESANVLLPDSMAGSVARVELDGSWGVASVTNRSVHLDGEILQQIFIAEVRSFRIFIVAPDLSWLMFLIEYDESGNVRLSIY